MCAMRRAAANGGRGRGRAVCEEAQVALVAACARADRAAAPGLELFRCDVRLVNAACDPTARASRKTHRNREDLKACGNVLAAAERAADEDYGADQVNHRHDADQTD